MNRRGFTLVELIIVIVVIAILATVSVVAYNGVQSRARDVKRKADVAQIVKLLMLYEMDNGPMYTGSGCGGYGNGSGYFNAQNSSSYPKSMMQCLIDAGLTTTVISDDSPSCSGLSCRTYMKYSCVENDIIVSYVYANLETVPHTSSDTDGTCPGAVNIDTSYGMNYYLKVG